MQPETFVIPTSPPTVSPLIGTAWDTIAGKEEVYTALGDLLRELDENAAMRSCALLRAIERARVELKRTPADAGLESPVALTLQDVALLVRAVLSRLR